MDTGEKVQTGIPFQVKLLDIPLQLIEKYRPFQKDKSVSGEINYWNICKKLKKVIVEWGITKSILFHCTRHSNFSFPLKHNVLQKKVIQKVTI